MDGKGQPHGPGGREAPDEEYTVKRETAWAEP